MLAFAIYVIYVYLCYVYSDDPRVDCCVVVLPESDSYKL